MSLPALPENAGLPALPPGMCPLCGADTAPGQEYCLECGERLTATPVFTAAAVGQMLPFTRRSWFWPAVTGFLVTGLAVAGVLFSGVLNKKPRVLNATPQFLTVVSFSSKTATVPRATTPGTAPAVTASAPRSNALSAWPAGRSSAYTIVLASLPAGSGRAQPLALARNALTAGLSQVGILDSRRFANLHPGYFVVFSGIYDSYAGANAALAQAHANGFNAAYVRQVSR